MLYVYDELDMAAMRFQLRVEGETVTALEANFKLHPAEVAAKNVELTTEKALASSDLGRTLGTLRYLKTLMAARSTQAAENGGAAADAATAGAAAAGAPEAQPPSTSDAAASAGAAAACSSDPTASCQPPQDADAAAGPEAIMCPICHEFIGAECAMMPCGHSLCYECNMMLIDQLPVSLAPTHRRVACPTCRVRHFIGDIAYVSASGSAQGARTIVPTVTL